MRKYIGTKLVEAEPAWKSDKPGYRVRYSDGYESWSPKAVFEQAYLPLEHNRKLKTDEPSISAQMVEDFIQETWTETLGEKTTVVRALLRNGFEIVESSSCVSPENYDEAMGREICLKKIREKVWMLLGFLLQTAVSGSAVTPETVREVPVAREETHPCGGSCVCERELRDFGWALRMLRHGCAVRRKGWNGKGICILLQVPDEHSKMTQPYIYIDTTGLQTENPAAPKGRVPWLASQTDMLAEDWEIVEK